jgi:hypothetical protein
MAPGTRNQQFLHWNSTANSGGTANGKQMPTYWSLACWQASVEVFPVFS